MKTTIAHNDRSYEIDLTNPMDISIPLRGDAQNVNAWGIGHPEIIPHTEDDFKAKVSEGAVRQF